MKKNKLDTRSYHHDGKDKKRRRNALGGDLTLGIIPFANNQIFICGSYFTSTAQVHLTQEEAKWLFKNLPKVLVGRSNV